MQDMKKQDGENDGLEFDGQENEGQQHRTNAVENHLRDYLSTVKNNPTTV